MNWVSKPMRRFALAVISLCALLFLAEFGWRIIIGVGSPGSALVFGVTFLLLGSVVLDMIWGEPGSEEDD